MKFVAKKTGDRFVVWLENKNRFVVFEPPAFEVFEQLAKNTDADKIAIDISAKYNLSQKESLHFVKTVWKTTEDLEKNHSEIHPENVTPEEFRKISEKNFRRVDYRIIETTFHFYYSGPWMMDLIHPGISHHETINSEGKGNCFHLVETPDELVLVVNRKKKICWPVSEQAYFKGSVSLQILNLLYGKNDNSWLGTIHASAVAKNGKSILMPGISGSGKSTLAALLAAHQFELVSDDLVPVLLEGASLVSFPSAISVKDGAMKTLEPFYPELKDKNTSLNKSTGKKSVCVFPPETSRFPSKASAVVLPKYSPEVAFKWEKVDNLSVLNDLLAESWIAANPKAVKLFLDWYFTLPCYRVQYNQYEKVLQEISALLG